MAGINPIGETQTVGSVQNIPGNDKGKTKKAQNNSNTQVPKEEQDSVVYSEEKNSGKK